MNYTPRTTRGQRPVGWTLCAGTARLDAEGYSGPSNSRMLLRASMSRFHVPTLLKLECSAAGRGWELRVGFDRAMRPRFRAPTAAEPVSAVSLRDPPRALSGRAYRSRNGRVHCSRPAGGSNDDRPHRRRFAGLSARPNTATRRDPRSLAYCTRADSIFAENKCTLSLTEGRYRD